MTISKTLVFHCLQHYVAVAPDAITHSNVFLSNVLVAESTISTRPDTHYLLHFVPLTPKTITHNAAFLSNILVAKPTIDSLAEMLFFYIPHNTSKHAFAQLTKKPHRCEQQRSRILHHRCTFNFVDADDADSPRQKHVQQNKLEI